MYFPSLASTRVLLASSSPRRLELLRLVGLDPTVLVHPTDESYPADLPAADVAEYVARKKAEACVGDLGPGDILIAGDTVVVRDGVVLGKPRDAEEARAMLLSLSGRTHSVYSAYAVAYPDGKIRSGADACDVTFLPVPDHVLDTYVATGAPLDKAGGYGIQDAFGALIISEIRGSYFTVMGLPVHLLAKVI
jgi:septum formation protein